MPDGSAVVRQGPPSLSISAASFPRRYPRATGIALVWLLGLYCAFLAKPPPITEEQNQAFRAKVKEAEGVLAELTVAEHALMEAQLDQRQYKVWFWRFKEAARREVQARQPAVDAAKATVRSIAARRDKALREAKAVLGLWSEAGVQEGRELFWESFASGKVFAQRQSFIDAVFAILGSRDRDWLSLMFQLLFQTLINFFTGLVASVFVFIVQLPSLIATYAPSVWTGVTYFVLAAVAAISVVAGYLGLLFGAGAAVTYSAVLLVGQQAERLEAQQQRQRIGYQRAHHD